jgi:hypothetical protein
MYAGPVMTMAGGFLDKRPLSTLPSLPAGRWNLRMWGDKGVQLLENRHGVVPIDAETWIMNSGAKP